MTMDPYVRRNTQWGQRPHERLYETAKEEIGGLAQKIKGLGALAGSALISTPYAPAAIKGGLEGLSAAGLDPLRQASALGTSPVMPYLEAFGQGAERGMRRWPGGGLVADLGRGAGALATEAGIPAPAQFAVDILTPGPEILSVVPPGMRSGRRARLQIVEGAVDEGGEATTLTEIFRTAPRYSDETQMSAFAARLGISEPAADLLMDVNRRVMELGEDFDAYEYLQGQRRAVGPQVADEVQDWMDNHGDIIAEWAEDVSDLQSAARIPDQREMERGDLSLIEDPARERRSSMSFEEWQRMAAREIEAADVEQSRRSPYLRESSPSRVLNRWQQQLHRHLTERSPFPDEDSVLEEANAYLSEFGTTGAVPASADELQFVMDELDPSRYTRNLGPIEQSAPAGVHMTVFGSEDVGQYADSAMGTEHVYETLADLIDDLADNLPTEYRVGNTDMTLPDLAEALRSPNLGYRSDALEELNNFTAEGFNWDLDDDGSLVLREVDELEDMGPIEQSVYETGDVPEAAVGVRDRAVDMVFRNRPLSAPDPGANLGLSEDAQELLGILLDFQDDGWPAGDPPPTIDEFMEFLDEQAEVAGDFEEPTGVHDELRQWLLANRDEIEFARVE